MIADAKRGDIGSTSQAYAEAWLAPRDGGPPVADAMTVNPYMGGDSLEPFLLACGAGSGLFVLVRTSNPGAADLQEQRLADGRRVWERTAELVAGWGAALVGESGLSSVGAVIGATSPEAVERARELMPHADACCCREWARRAAAPAISQRRSGITRPAAWWWRRGR